MTSNLSSGNADGCAKQMTDHPEWKRMTREIVTLRQINAELAEKVTTLEMKLESIYSGEHHDEASVSLQLRR
jgi:hypothetical protein